MKRTQNLFQKALLTSAISMSIAATSLTANAEQAGTFYINPAVGIQTFDGKRDADEAVTAIFGGEYVITSKWGIEASYMISSPDGEDGNQDADLDQIRIGALYYLPETGNWKPFLGLGIADAEFEYDTTDHVETQVHVGGGARYSFNEDWSARLDARAINSLDEEAWDALLSVGVSYAFGGSSYQKTEEQPMAVAAPAVVDSDGDGVADDLDKCPNTPAGVAVNSSGCPLDTDGDGVYDYQDQCPGTPAGAPVDAKGCPLDSDGDGVPDYKDQCPTTAAGAQVDENGCKVMIEKTVSINLAINFPTNSAVVPQTYYAEIERVADFMKEYKNTSVTIQGHTDDRGNAGYNKSLSQKRADSVAAILVSNYGIEASRVEAQGFGEEQPIADNNTAAGRKENRRVVAEIENTITQ